MQTNLPPLFYGTYQGHVNKPVTVASRERAVQCNKVESCTLFFTNCFPMQEDKSNLFKRVGRSLRNATTPRSGLS